MSRILVDYDQTLCATQQALLDVCNVRFGEAFTSKDITSWLTEKHLPLEYVTYMWGADGFLNVDVQANANPVDGAIQGMLALMDAGHQPMIVSDRPPELFEVTRDWLDRHGLDMVRLLFTRHKHSKNTSTKGMTKVQAAYLYKLDTIIEDAPHHAEAFALKPYVDHIFLLDMPYNQLIHDEKVQRVHSWSDIVGAMVL